MNKIAVLVVDESDQQKSEQLAEKFQVPLINSVTKEDGYLLLYSEGALKIMRTDEKIKSAFSIDFFSTKAKHHKLNQGRGKLPIIKACGIKHNQRPSIIDATAGLGQDSFLLASFGSMVTCIEQQPIIAELLMDALSRAKRGSDKLGSESIIEIANRMNVICDYAETYLKRHQADVVYLDPMYPIQENPKQAKVKKQMQLLRDLDGTESNEQALFASAIKACKKRLVVKRPNWASHLAGKEPTHHIPGKTHRYDVYLH